jgi:hypothetical protein
MKDIRKHYPKDPIIWDMLSGVWKTSGTICGKRRDTGRITINPVRLTCTECIGEALTFWTEQRDTCASLIEYAESGKLTGTSAEKESKTLLPNLRQALEIAAAHITELSKKAGVSQCET